MSRSRVWRVAASVVALSAVAAGGARLALAERGDPVIVESFAAVEDPAVAARVEAQVEPAVEIGDEKAIASTQIRAVWADAITRVPGPLAKGDTFPDVETVDPAGGEDALYEDTMFEYIALNVWRCSWIGEELANGPDKADIDRLRGIDATIVAFGSKASEQLMASLDEWHSGRHTTATTTIRDYQEEYGDSTCRSFGMSQK